MPGRETAGQGPASAVDRRRVYPARPSFASSIEAKSFGIPEPCAREGLPDPTLEIEPALVFEGRDPLFEALPLEAAERPHDRPQLLNLRPIPDPRPISRPEPSPEADPRRKDPEPSQTSGLDSGRLAG